MQTRFISSATNCPADKDPWPVKFPNYLSALSAGELVRRIALHREIPKGLKFPGAEWADMQVCFYITNTCGAVLFFLLVTFFVGEFCFPYLRKILLLCQLFFLQKLAHLF